MGKKVWLEDITIRDGAQSLWATRLSTAEIVPIASTIDRVGFDVVDVTGGAAIDSSIMYMQEDPFERTRVLSELMPNSRLNFNSRGQSVFRWTQYPDDVAELTIRTFANNGIGSIMLFDPLNDMRNLQFSADVAKRLGLYVIGSVTYTISPYHTIEHFIEKTKELVDMGVDAVSLKDPSGLLTVDRALALLSRMRPIVRPDQKLQLHCHTSTGTGKSVHLAAMDMGADAPDVFHGAAPPLAWGRSHPSHQFLVENLKQRGYELEVDTDAIEEMSAYFSYLAKRRGLPSGDSFRDEEEVLNHQIPGGMMSNMIHQLADQGLSHRVDEVLEEVQEVRRELGYPILVSPVSQYVGTQAVLNVVTGTRYQVVPDEIRNYLLGYYGSPPGPVDPQLKTRILGDREPIASRPGEVLEPMVQEFKSKHGPFGSDEELVLAIMYSEPTLRAWNRKDWNGYARTPKDPLTFLLDEVGRRSDVSTFLYERSDGALSVSLTSEGQQ